MKSPPRRLVPRLERLEDRSLPTASVPTFAGNAQHTGLFQPAGQDLAGIKWQTPVDLAPQNQGGTLFIHYGTPLITAANTVLVPVKTGATDGFEINAFNATGTPLYSLPTDYTLPSHDWTPSYSPTLATTPSGTRLYYAGAGGTLYYIDNPDSTTPATPVQQVFYTTLANYQSNVAAFNSTVYINTPLTSDSQGDVFFGFRVQGTAPAPLSTTQSGFARIDPSGKATYVLAGTAAGDPSIGWDTHNSAPALSNDGSTLYVAVKAPDSDSHGYLLGLDSTTLATKYKVFLKDPSNGNDAGLLDDGTASPMVGPDGDVYFGVMGSPFNGSRGFLLHFDSTLAVEKLPGAFGWDYTAAIVPASMVPHYDGTSPYLLFSKYNNYASTEVGSSGGDGVNQIAILDPNAAETDPRNDGAPTLQVMREVLTVPGPTPDPGNISPSTPHAVREWCISSAAVNPSTDSVFMPSEDGHLYRWCLDMDALEQALSLGTGIGEAYVPTVIGPDGTVYSINDAILFAAGNQTGVSLSATSSAEDVRTTVAGQSVTFSATVTSTTPSGPVPTGTVTFQDGSSTLGTVPLDSQGHASLTTSTLTPAGHLIAVVYSGDSNFSTATTTLVQFVHSSATKTTLTASPSPVAFGHAVTLTATVTPLVSGLGSLTGTVEFTDGGKFLGQAPVSGGTATFTTSALGVGSHTIAAVYNADPVYATSQALAASALVVAKAATTTTLSASPTAAVHGQAVRLFATVSASVGTPTGTVTFQVGSTVLGTVSLHGGEALLLSRVLPTGGDTITAHYNGDGNFTASSRSTRVTLGKDATTTSLKASLNPAAAGQTVAFTATVLARAPGSGTPAGTVTFMDGSTVLGTVTLRKGVAVLRTANLTRGPHRIRAFYSGDGNFSDSSSAAVIEAIT